MCNIRMNNTIEIDLILNRQKYPRIYSTSLIIIIIILVFIYIIFTYKYQSYYLSKGKMINNKLELLVPLEDIKYIKNNNYLSIDNQKYSYKLTTISNEIYVDEEYNNYKYIYLDIKNLTNIDNYVYEIKIPKENKILAKYLKEYL